MQQIPVDTAGATLMVAQPPQQKIASRNGPWTRVLVSS